MKHIFFNSFGIHMPPKKNSGKQEEEKSSGGGKGTKVRVRHILCEKQSKIL